MEGYLTSMGEMRIMKRWAFMNILLVMVVFWPMDVSLWAKLTVNSTAGGQLHPRRFMPFLCRDAVIRESAERFALVGKGMPAPAVVMGKAPPGPRQRFEDKQIRKAADVLVKYLEKITGVRCQIVSDVSDAPQGSRIFVGADGDPVKLFPELDKADAHGFLLATKPGSKETTNLYLIGASGTGTLYAVWFFLMNYADLRIVMPGEIGEVYPKLDRLEIPRQLYLFNPGPDFLLRIWSGQGGFDPTAWLADYGETRRFEYHHNMWRIYDVRRFGKTHPEFYPVVEGRPMIPDPDKRSGWQPTFSEPSVVRRAIEYADERFTERPDLISISLSVNDGLGYSEVDMRKGKLLPDGRVSISDIYYRYVNAVARGIRKRWPGKYVAFFPYNLVEIPPDFKLEDNVILFLLNEPKTTYEMWKGKVKHIGVYQWLYGIGWVIPNHWPHAMQDYLRWVYAHGGRAFKGEAYVAWAQGGPKMWVLNNLLWNVDADVETLLRDYYDHAYGEEAAPAMARYFAQAERIYERRRTEREYRIARHRPGEYQFQYAKPEDFRIMAEALEEANRVVRGEANRIRVEMVTRCFRWGRYYWQQYHKMQLLRTAEVKREADVEKVLKIAMSFYSSAQKREAYYRQFIEPLAQYCVYSDKPDKVSRREVDPGFRWEGFDEAMDKAFGAISSFKERTQGGQQVAAFWEEVGRRYERLKPFAETQRLLILYPNVPLRNLLSNGSFEEPPGPPKGKYRQVARDWYIYHNRMVNASVRLDYGIKHSGEVSVTAKGLTDYSGLIRWITLKNGARYRLSFWYRTSEEVRHVFYGILSPPRLEIRVHLPPAGRWSQVERVFTLNYPGGERRSVTLLLCLRHGGSEGSQVWFDDVRLEMLTPEGVAR